MFGFHEHRKEAGDQFGPCQQPVKRRIWKELGVAESGDSTLSQWGGVTEDKVPECLMMLRLCLLAWMVFVDLLVVDGGPMGHQGGTQLSRKAGGDSCQLVLPAQPNVLKEVARFAR